MVVNHLVSALLCLVMCMPTTTRSANMNAGGIPYTISNPASTGEYSTEFGGEYFDVYGQVDTKYSQVYWKRNPVYTLPQEIIDRFHNKVMAIVGYEVDQVVTDDPTFKVNTPDNDKSVPIYHAYNHHYFAWLNGAQSEMYDLKSPRQVPNPTRTAFRNKPFATKAYPHNIKFVENPGGEFRKSYHGYPKGYAQLIYSPTQWIVEPMQIDTHNRNKSNITDQTGYHAWFLPAMEKGKNDPNSQLSPLIECPCSNRITVQAVNRSAMLITGNCPSSLLIGTESDCVAAVQSIVGKEKVSSAKTVSNSSMARGCIMIPKQEGGDIFDVVFNSNKTSVASCGETGKKNETFSGVVTGQHAVNVGLSHDGVTAMIKLSGPAQFWFGVGFDANEMADQPYTIIVDGNGKVTERTLASHAPGELLRSSISVVSQHVSNGTRFLTLKRLVAGASAKYYTFPSKPGVIDMIMAIGDTVKLAYHKAHDTGVLELLATSQASCVCAPTSTEYLTYHAPNAAPVSRKVGGYYCAPEPRGDMAKLKNPACSMKTYHGGLKCCLNSWFLTDLEQDAEHSGPTDTYYIKFRYYFEEFVAGDEEKQVSASHIHLTHWVFLIDEAVNDYEEDPHVGGEGIGKITAHVLGSQMGLEDIPPSGYSALNFFVMTPHCHAPSCLWQELWNADTGELICNVTAQYGTGTEVFNEWNYVALPPCIFGYESGLEAPPIVKPDTHVTAVKYFNNTFRHLGQMAQWVGLMTYT